MLRIQIGNNVVEVKSSFSELTVRDFSEYMKREALIEIENEKKATAYSKLGVTTDVENDYELRVTYDAAQHEAQNNITFLRVEQLAVLSGDYEKTNNLIMNIKGLRRRDIVKIFRELDEYFGSFSEYFNWINPVDSFRFRDYKKAHIFNFSKVRRFHVFDMAGNTLLRDAAATRTAAAIGQMEDEFKSNSWENLATFCATVARPKNEKVEISATAKGHFFGGKNTALLNASDRLAAYNDQLGEVVSSRAEVFAELPLTLALAIYKQYFFFARK